VSGVDPNLRAQIRAQIEADYGEHTIMSGGKMPRPRRLPTGSLALDYVSGGGYAFAHMTRFWGPWSSGKTLAMFMAFISAQNFGELRYRQLMALSELALRTGDARDAKVLKDQAKREREYKSLACLFVNSEKSIDVDHMKRIGVDMNKLDIAERSTIEDIGKMVYRSLRGYHVIGIDSTTDAMSISEIGDEDDENNDGDNIYGSYPFRRATSWGINMDWWRSRLTRENLILFTSHATQRVGARQTIQGSVPEHPPGGTKLNHEPGLVLHFVRGGALKRKSDGGLEEIKSDDPRGTASASAFAKFQPAGGSVFVICDKNKVGAAGRVVVLHHDKRTGAFDPLWEYEKMAKYYRVGVNGTWWTLPDGTKVQQARKALTQSPDLRAQIESVVLHAAEDPVWESSLLAGRTEVLVEVPSADSV
jgi:RecA/RadA recombinase